MVFLVMLSCLIFKCNADGGIPSFAAAPFGPVTLPLLDEVVHRCGDLLNPTHLFSGQTVDISFTLGVFDDERNHDRAFPHGRRNAFDIAASHITGRENSWEAGFEQVWPTSRRPVRSAQVFWL